MPCFLNGMEALPLGCCAVIFVSGRRRPLDAAHQTTSADPTFLTVLKSDIELKKLATASGLTSCHPIEKSDAWHAPLVIGLGLTIRERSQQQSRDLSTFSRLMLDNRLAHKPETHAANNHIPIFFHWDERRLIHCNTCTVSEPHQIKAWATRLILSSWFAVKTTGM